MKRIRIALLVALSLLGVVSPLVPVQSAEATERHQRHHRHQQPDPTGLVIEIRNADHHERALMDLWYSRVGLGGEGGRAQWEVVPIDGNVVAFRNVATDDYLRARSDHWVGTGRASRGLHSSYLWQAIQNDDGSYLLLNEATGKYLDGDRSNYGKRDKYSVDLNRHLAKGTSWLAVPVGKPKPTPTATATPSLPVATSTAIPATPTTTPVLPTATAIPATPTTTPVLPTATAIPPTPTTTPVLPTATAIPPTPTVPALPTATPTTVVAPTATPTVGSVAPTPTMIVIGPPTATPTVPALPTATPTTVVAPTATPTVGSVAPTPTTIVIGPPTATPTTVVAPTATPTTVVAPTATPTTVVPPTATATVVPPTATATVVPPTATATVVPPTATATAVPPTATATAVPPTPTPSPTPTDPTTDIRVVTGTLVDAIAASNNLVQPVVGATIRIDGIETTTDQNGDFFLLGVPVGVRNLEIDGSTATFGSAGQPYTDYRNTVEISSAPGVVVDLGVFNATPRTGFTVQVSPQQDVIVTSPDVTALVAGSRTALEVAAGSAFDIATGQLFAGSLSITQVPNCCTPSSMPQFVLDADPLIVTVQPLGVSFNPPAALDLPNTKGYAPGAIVDLWSLNPDTGAFEVKGQGQVTTDGTTIETISGGLVMTDWHFFIPPPAVAGQPQWNFNLSTFQRVPANTPVALEIRSGFTDPDGDVLTFSLDSDGGWGGSIDPLNGVISGPALGNNELATVVVRASDGALSITRSITIEGASEPIYIGPRRFQAPPSGVFTIDFSELFINPGQQDLTYELENGIESPPAPGASVDEDTGIFTIDVSQLGFYDFSVQATNESGTDSPYLVLNLVLVAE